MRSEKRSTYRRFKEDVPSQSGLVLQCAYQISRRTVDILSHPSGVSTSHAIYPIEKTCSSLKRKRAAPHFDSLSTSSPSGILFFRDLVIRRYDFSISVRGTPIICYYKSIMQMLD